MISLPLRPATHPAPALAPARGQEPKRRVASMRWPVSARFPAAASGDQARPANQASGRPGAWPRDGPGAGLRPTRDRSAGIARRACTQTAR